MSSKYDFSAQLQLSMFSLEMFDAAKAASETMPLDENAREALMLAGGNISTFFEDFAPLRNRLNQSEYNDLLLAVHRLGRSAFTIGSQGIVSKSAKSALDRLRMQPVRAGKIKVKKEAAIFEAIRKHDRGDLLNNPTKFSEVVSKELANSDPPIKLSARTISKRLAKMGLITPRATRGRPKKPSCG